MGITAIPSVVAAPPSTDGRPALKPPTTQQSQPTASPRTDTVRLSEAQQVYQLYNQGQQIRQIAESLNLTVSAVNRYLNLTH